MLLGAATNNLGNLYTQLGRHGDAKRLQIEALADQRAAYGDSHPVVLLSLLDLGHAHEDAGEGAEAQARYREALAIAILGLNELRPFIQHLRRVVTRALEARDTAAARSALGVALRVWETATQIRTGAEDLHYFSRLLLEAGELNRAEANLREAMRRLGSGPDADPTVAAVCLYDLGRVEEERGENADATAYFRQALEVLGDANMPSLTAEILLGLGRTGDVAEAEGHLRRALRLAEDEADSRVQAAAWHHLGRVYHDAARFDEARDCFHRSLALREQDDSPDRSTDLVELAELAIRSDDLDAAESWLSQVEALEKESRTVPSVLAFCLKLRGGIALRRGNRDDALFCLRAALDQHARDAPSNDALRGSILAELGGIYLARGETRTAQAILDEARNRLSASAANRPVELGIVLSQLAGCEYSRGDLAEASDNIRKARDLLEPVLDPNHLLLGELWRIAGMINLSAGARKTAESQLQRARGIFAGAKGPEPSAGVALVDLQLAILQHIDGRWEECRATASRAATVLEQGRVPHTQAVRWQAIALAALDQKEAAIDKMLEVANLVTANFSGAALTVASPDRTEDGLQIKAVLDQLLSLAVHSELSSFAPKVFTAVQRSKAVISETIAVQREFAETSISQETRDRWTEIAELHSFIGRGLYSSALRHR